MDTDLVKFCIPLSSLAAAGGLAVSAGIGIGGLALAPLGMDGSGVDREIIRFLQQNWPQLLEYLDIPR